MNKAAWVREYYCRMRADFSAQPRYVRWLLGLAMLEFFYIVAQGLDTLVFTTLRDFTFGGSAQSIIEMFKIAGFLPVWIIGAAVLAVHDWQALGGGIKRIFTRGALLFAGAGGAMIAAELLKLVVRRERPQAWLDVLPVFRAWSGNWWQSNDLGMPSSHAATAFGAAFVLARFFPAAAPAWFAIAACCALSRVVEQAHTLTDVYAGAVVAWVITDWLLAMANKRDKTKCGG